MNEPACRYCDAPMYESRVARNPVWAVVVGWVLIPTALLTLGIAGALALVDRGVREDDWFEQERTTREAREALLALDRPEWGLVDEFDQTGDLSRETIDALPEPERGEVRAIDRRHEAHKQAGELASEIMLTSVKVFLPMALWFGIPGLLMGIYLVSWRRAWRCTECGALA